MPWFEPSSRAPRCGGPRNNNNNIINDGEEEEWSDGQQNNNRRNNYRSSNDYHHEQEIRNYDYLDLNWQHVSNSEDNNDAANYDDNNYSATRTATAARQRRVNFDGFQHRVEHQLGSAVFPASFAGLNSSLYHTATNYNNSSNNSSSHHQLLFSKTAQFFHPRQVLALRQYEGLFSPLDASAAQHSDDCHESLRQINTTNNDNNNDNGGGGEHSSTNLHTILQPRNLFHSSQSQNHIQATLRQDPTTGQLLAATSSGSSEHHHHSGGNNKTSSWDNYGGRPQMFDGSNVHGPVVNEENENNNSKKKATKKKKKDKSKGKSGEDKNEQQQQQQRIDSMFQSKMGADGNDTTHGGGNDNNDTKKKKSNKMTKKKKRSYLDHETSCELTIPTNNQVDKDDNNMLLSTTTTTNRTLQTSSNSTTTTTPTLAEEDFEGMSNILNAAQCMEGLQQFLSRVGEVTYVAWTMIFLDPLCHYRQYYGVTANNDSSTGGKRRKRSKKFALKNTNDSAAAATMLLECTTPFLPSNKRYCTDKGPTCTAWNCTCDDQIRAMRGGAPLLGAMFVLDMRDEEGVGGSGCGAEGGRGEKECYLLPLGPTEKCLDGGLEAGYSRMKSWPVIPFDCDVSLSDRWSAFEAIISNNLRKMVTYNATTALMPFYYHQFHDSMNEIGGESQVSQIDSMLSSSSQFTSYLTASQDDNHSHFQRPANLRSIWDLRLVSWMLRPDVSDDQLEWSTFKSGFSHLVPDSTIISYDGMPIVSRGLMEARSDLALLHSLYPLINEQLIRQDLLRSLENIEAPVQSILTSMECRGVGFYPQRLKRVESQLSARIDELEARSRAFTNDSDFLLSSPQQVSQYLFDTLKLNVPEGLTSKTKSSHRSTSEEALKAIKSDATAKTGSAPEILDIILEFRTLSKLLTTYIRPLPRLCVRGKGKSKKTPSRIHPQWMMTAVRTGRLSCRKPNLQQLPSDAVFGVKPRDAFVPSAREGMCVFACDYSQKEVRILAHMSNDEALISLFRGDTNIDIYKQMASLIRNKPAELITSDERAQFKQVTLALLYGMSANQVAKKLSISKSAAQQTMNDFFRRFRRVKSWMEETKQMARRNGYVLTIAGRRRYLNDIRSEDNGKRSQAERQAINTVIQGSAADLMKTAMIQLSENLQSWHEVTTAGGQFAMNSRPQMVLQIHDEVLLELRFNEGDIKKLQAIAVKSCCRDCEELFNLKVPLHLKCSCGLSFGSMKEI